MTSAPLVIHDDMWVISFQSGIKLIKQATAPHENAPTVASLMQLPFSVYFLDVDGRTVLINQEGALACGFSSAPESIGKSLLSVSNVESAIALIDNCRIVNETNKTHLFEEENLRQDGKSMRFFSVKIPWYDANNTPIGILGVSIVLGEHSLPDAIAKLTTIGLLNQQKFSAEASTPIKQFKVNNIHLTKREMQCLQLTMKGYTAKRIAKELGLSFRTVEEYLTNIRIKAGVNSKSELIEMVIQDFQSTA